MREFLTSRRARISPDRAGLPAYGGNRRVPGLRREEVALLAGVSIDYYIRLERGNLSGVSESVLDALADALAARRSRAGPPVRPGPGGEQHPAHPAATWPAAGPGQCPADPRRHGRGAGVRTQRPPGHPGREPARLRALLGDVPRPGPPGERRPVRLPQPPRPHLLPRLGAGRRATSWRSCAPRPAGTRTTGP